MWYGQRVAVVFPAYNEEKNIAQAIDDFFAAGGERLLTTCSQWTTTVGTARPN